MARISIGIDDVLVREVMRKYSLSTPKEAVDLALRRLVGSPLRDESLVGIRGIGWGGDLDQLRLNDSPWEPRESG